MTASTRFSATVDDTNVRRAVISEEDVAEETFADVAEATAAGVEAEATVTRACHREDPAAMRNSRPHADGRGGDLGHAHLPSLVGDCTPRHLGV